MVVDSGVVVHIERMVWMVWMVWIKIGVAVIGVVGMSIGMSISVRHIGSISLSIRRHRLFPIHI